MKRPRPVLYAAGMLGLAEDVSAGGEVGAEDVLQTQFEVGTRLVLGFVDERDAGVDDFGEVVRRDVGGHADGDAGAAVDEEVGDAGGKDGGFERGLVVVGGEVDGVGVDVCEHLAGDAGEARLGVTHGGGRIAIDGAEVALAIDHGIAQAEVLREADHGVVDGGVAVGMIVAHDVADDLGGLGVLLVELQAHLRHAVEDAAMDGLEAVADVGQGAADDDRHGVVEIAAPHLVLDVDGVEECGSAALHDIGAIGRRASGGRGGGLRGRVFGVLRVGWKEFVSHDLWLYYRRFWGAPAGRKRGVLVWLAGEASTCTRCPGRANSRVAFIVRSSNIYFQR